VAPVLGRRFIGEKQIVLVDDGPRDRTGEIMAKEASKYLDVFRGPSHARPRSSARAHDGTWRRERILIIDANLQDPSELLPEIMPLTGQRAGVVYGQQRLRDADSMFKRIKAAVLSGLTGRMTNIDLPCDAGDLRSITRRVLDLLVAMPQRHRFIRGVVAWFGGTKVPLVYDRTRGRRPPHGPGQRRLEAATHDDD
jgi:polyisoprenyl-phosphate glycosyltransferase